MLMSQQVHCFSQTIMYISKAKTYFLQYQMDEVCRYCFNRLYRIFQRLAQLLLGYSERNSS